MEKFKFIDLFCGVGGFHQALTSIGGQCVFASDIDKECQEIYFKNYGIRPIGDITKVEAKDIPEHDVLCGGFPCFVAGTMVKTSKGYKRIEDVEIGDEVLTHKCRYQKVLDVMKRKYDGDMFIVKGFNANEIYCTADHPFYVKKKRLFDSFNDTAPEWISPRNLHQLMADQLDPTMCISEDTIQSLWIGYPIDESVAVDKERQLQLSENTTVDDDDIVSYIVNSEEDAWNAFETLRDINHRTAYVEKTEDNKWSLKWHLINWPRNCTFKDGYVWVKVDVLQPYELDNPIFVYNLSVEEDQSYTANGIAVHNCQAFSGAGKQLGFNDPTRGTLFFDIIRILNYHHPKYVLLENVKNLAKHDNGNTWKVIHDSLDNAGYNVSKEPVIFSPHYLGIPQKRERVFIMGVRKDLGQLPKFHFNPKKDSVECSIETILQDDNEIKDIEKYKLDESTESLLQVWDDFLSAIRPHVEKLPTFPVSDVGLKCTEETVRDLPEARQGFARQCMELYSECPQVIDEWLGKAKKNPRFKNSRAILEWHGGQVDNPSMWDVLIQIRQSGIRTKLPNYFPTLVAVVQTPILGMRKRYITPRECARLQSFPEDFILHEHDKTAYKQFGNSVNVEVVKLFAKFLLGDKEVQEKYCKKETGSITNRNDRPTIEDYPRLFSDEELENLNS